MTRLQKKCLIAAASTHLLVVVVVLCSGFITSKPRVDETQVLDMIPANVLDNVLNQGVKGAQLPPPTPEPPKPLPPVQDPPTPEPPKPEKPEPPKPEKPEPKVQPEELKPVEQPDVEIPKPKPVKKPHEVKVDLKLVKRDTRDVQKEAAEAAAKAEQDAQRERDRKLKAFKSAVRNISKNASSATSVEMPGSGSVSYANYASVVRSVYEQAWIAPDNADNDDAVVKVSVTIARDGHVISSRVLNPSGDSKVDNSVQRTLDRVRFVREFPDGAKEPEKTFIINFNLKAKRMLG